MVTSEQTVHGNYRNVAAENSLTPRRPLFSTLRWSAILAGVAVGVALQLGLTLLGIATGLSSVDVSNAEGASTTAPLLWAGISMLISAFVGGYVAARSSGLKRTSDGLLHGATAWAVTTLLFAVLTASAAGNMLGGIFGGMSAAMNQTGGNGHMASNVLNRQLGNIDPAMLTRFENHIKAGRRDQAIALLTDSLGMDQERASTIVDQALIVAGNPDQASLQGRADAARTIDVASSTAWMIFGAIALSLALALVGGLLGANGARRTIWGENGTAPRATA
jgi:hypothetical protein